MSLTGSLGAFEKGEVLEAVRAQRARTLALLEQLPHHAWEKEVLPRWRLREVVAHLITTDEGALTGRMLQLGFSTRPMSEVERWNDRQVGRWANRPVPALIAALERWGTRMARLVSLQPAPLMQPRIRTPFGRVSIGWLLMLRVYDEWVHGEDIRRALGSPSDDAPGSVRPVAKLLLAGIPVQTLPALGPSKGRVVLRLEEPTVDPVGFDLEARRYGPSVAGETEISAHAAPLIMVAAGRDEWRAAEASGVLRIRGERGPAEVLLDALRVV